jgi:hypothetical protein
MIYFNTKYSGEGDGFPNSLHLYRWMFNLTRYLSAAQRWSIKIKAIWVLKFSSFGVRFVSDAGFGHIPRYTKLKVHLFLLPLLSPAYFAKPIVVLGVSLEQVDKLLVESTPRKSKYWVPTTTLHLR